MVITQHGWGFGSDFWIGWQEGIHLDRGYFDRPFEQSIKEESLVIVHSFGLHLLSFVGVKQLVIISGFLDIHSNSRTKAYIKCLKKKLESNPKKALEKFYRDCGVKKGIFEVESINTSLLLEDLERLKCQKLEIAKLAKISDILILHGGQDKIASVKKGMELHQLLPQSKLIIFDQADHALPVTYVKDCLIAIEDWRQCLQHAK